MWIKICGITRPEDAMAAAAYGADAIGFLFAEGPRGITPSRAREISLMLPSGVERIGVFIDEPEGQVREIVDHCKLDGAQLNGRELPQYCWQVCDNAIKGIAVKTSSDLHAERDYRPGRVVLDGYYNKPCEGCRRLDWEALPPGDLQERIIVAGGLDPGNVSWPIAFLRPYGVDVSAGVESAPGIKDHALLRSFIETARTVDYEVNRID